jgi:hypothetical protein
MEVSSFISDFEKLPKQIQKQVFDYIEFLIAKYKKSDKDNFDYYERIQTVSKWSEEDVKYLSEIKDNYNWKIEEW